MADISTGRQRGIVPFVDETTGRLPDQYLPQGVIDLQGDLEQAVTEASASATAAKASETAAKASADSATQSASAAAQSAESASGDASAAKASADGAASSAGAAKASETAAASSATAAAESKDAAKASETAAARSAQTATEQVSSIGDSVGQAAASATAAQQSASQAQSNATAANSSAQAAAVSAESAQTAAESAASSKDAAAQSASEASASAQAAETSKTNAASSAAAAEASKTSAAASASAAQASETNAAASATAAQQAVDGFGLEAGTTTTGEPGTDAAVEIQKTGTKYTANFTIPRGDKGADGVNENVPLGTASGIVAQASDAYPVLPRKVQVHGRTIDVHTVEPEKLEAVGKNLIYGWEIGSLSSSTGNAEGSNIEVRSSPSRVIPGMQYTLTVYKPSGFNKIRYYGFDGTYLGFNLVSNLKLNLAGSVVFTVPENVGSIRFVFTNTDTDKFTEMLPNMDSVVQLESGSKSTQWSLGQMTETNLPSGISLADGDTLTIDRDGTTQIVHAEGEPTVLENVTLPQLPAPTFNVYTTGGYIQPTVDVGYEQDVNLVLQALEAKIASLEVTQTIMKGA